MNLPPECKDCPNECRIEFGMSMETCAYYPSIYNKQGENINPDRNTTTGEASCNACGKKWNYSACAGETTWSLK